MSTAREPRRSPARKAVNVTVDAALLSAARVEDINLSATLERALTEELRRARRERWRAENARAIAAYNEQVDEHGVFSDALRSF